MKPSLLPLLFSGTSYAAASLPVTVIPSEAFFLGWITLGSLFATSLFIELPSIRWTLGRSWFPSFVMATLVHLLLPALVLALPIAAHLAGFPLGSKPSLSDEGVTLSLPTVLLPFNEEFFVSAAIGGFVLALLKFILLRPLSVERARLSRFITLVIMGFISNSVFLAGLTFRPDRAIASLQKTVQEGGAKQVYEKTIRQIADPIVKQYEERMKNLPSIDE